jgi:Type VI secretion system/phage-baseplate injector OB domain
MAQLFAPRFTNPSVAVVAAHCVELVESFNEHPALVARLTVGRIKSPSDLLGEPIQWAVPFGDKPKPVFQGVITSAESTGNVATIVAQGKSVKRDLVRRTRSFGGGPDHKCIKDLSNIQEIVKDVGGVDALRLRVHHLLQFEESDWRFLVRTAGFNGLVVLNGLKTVALTNAEPSTFRTIRSSEIIEGSMSLFVGLGSTGVSSLTWNPRTGAVPSQPVLAEPTSPKSALLSELLAKCKQFSDQQKHELYGCGLDNDRPDSETARLNAKTRVAGLMRVKFQMPDPQIGVGTGVRLSLENTSYEQLVVVRRTLSYIPNSSSGCQLFNEIDCRPVGHVQPEVVRHQSALNQVVGQVSNVTDPQKLGRVKVTFPWQKRSDNKPQNWEGVWCLVPQAMGGFDEKGIGHGSLCLPAPFDWVSVLVDSTATGPPVVLGVLYRGGRGRVSDLVKDPEHDRILFTAAGFRICLQDTAADGTPCLTVAIQSQNKDVTKIVLTGDGQFIVEAAKARITGREEIAVIGKTTIDGSLSVK